MPGEILEEKVLKLRLVDTRGIDTTVERADLDSHLRDPATVVALCTSFNDAPAISVQAPLEQAQRSGTGNLDAKAIVLALVYPDQASGVKYDDGAEVETVEEGYALKAHQVWMQLAVREGTESLDNNISTRGDFWVSACAGTTCYPQGNPPTLNSYR